MTILYNFSISPCGNLQVLIITKIEQMSSQVFISLPVRDLGRSMSFYANLGFTNNPQFSDDATKCMVWSDTIFVMLINHDKFKTYTAKPIADTKNQIAAMFALTVDSEAKVQEIVNKGLKEGGAEPVAFHDYGFMQRRTIEDFDGHTWEIVHVDVSKFPSEQA